MHAHSPPAIVDRLNRRAQSFGSVSGFSDGLAWLRLHVGLRALMYLIPYVCVRTYIPMQVSYSLTTRHQTRALIEDTLKSNGISVRTQRVPVLTQGKRVESERDGESE